MTTHITLEYLKANNSELVPHIEERAIQLSHKQTVMLQNVAIANDLTGWADRKVSSYLDTGYAGELEEATDIPLSNIYRARLSTSTPKEWGLSYNVTNRHISTNGNNIISTIITALGVGLRNRIENALIESAYNSFMGREFSNSSHINLADLFAIVTYASHVTRSPGGLLFVFHPYQIFHLLKDLLQLPSAGLASESRAALANSALLPDLRNTAYTIPNIGAITISSNIPRNITYRMFVYGSAGSFRLQVGDKELVTPTSGRSTSTKYNITTAISAVTAQLTTANIKAALDNLNYGAWTVGGTRAAGFTLQPPDDLYLTDRKQLRVAIKVDAKDDVTLDSNDPISNVQKSKYDLVSGNNPVTATGHNNKPRDKDNVAMGLKLIESGSPKAKALAFKRNALLFDQRDTPTIYTDDLNDGRTLRYAYYQTFGTAGWEVRDGFTVESTAEAPSV